MQNQQNMPREKSSLPYIIVYFFIITVLYLVAALAVGYALCLFFTSLNPDFPVPHIGYPVQSKFMILPALMAASLCVFGYRSKVLAVCAYLSIGGLYLYVHLLAALIEVNPLPFILQDFSELLFLCVHLLIFILLVCCYFDKRGAAIAVVSCMAVALLIWLLFWRFFQNEQRSFIELFRSEALAGLSVPFSALLCGVACIAGVFRDIQRIGVHDMIADI